MMRFIAKSILFILTSVTLVSCTSTSTDEDSLSNMAIEDDANGNSSDATAGAGVEDENEVSSSGKAAPEVAKGEDDLESEFDKSDQTPSETAEQPAGSEEKSLEDELNDSPATAEAPVASPVENETAAAPNKQEKARVQDIRYMANSSGGTVVIDTSRPVTYQTRMNPETQQFIIEMAGVELPASLRRPYLTKDFNSRIGGINAYQESGSDTARVVIQLSGQGDGEPVVQQEGTSLVVVPPAATSVAQQPPASVEKPVSSNGQPLSARTLDEFLTGNQRFYGRPISLQIKEADVRDVINFLAEESGANIVMSENVKGQIALKLRKVPWDQALVTIMRSRDLGYVRQGNILRISTLKELQGEAEAASKVIEAQKAIVPSIVQVIPVSYANMDDMVKNLTPFLSKDGKLVADSRTNTLIATDKGEVVDRIQKLVKTLDIPPAQVSIETKIVEASEEFSGFAGVNWGFSGASKEISSSGGASGAPVDMTLSAGAASVTSGFTGGTFPFRTNLQIGTLDIFGSLTASLMLAEQNNLAKVISSPRISAMNREKSTIMQKGENVSIVRMRNETTNVETKSEKRTPFTLELGVTPQITADGSVIMDLDVKREFLGPVTDVEMQTREVNTRSAKTKIMVRNGQTAVIGGIYTNDETEGHTGVPGLMHVPILGWLFKSRSETRRKNELLIFLTPRILVQEEVRSSI